MTNNKKDNPTPEQQAPMALPQEYKIVPADYGYQYDEDEIDLLELAKTIWNKRMFILKIVGIGAILPKKELMTSVPGATEESLVLNLSKDEFGVISTLRQKITASLDEQSGIVSVTVTLPDNVAAAAVTEYTIRELTEYLTEYRTEKVLRDLTFVEEQLATAEVRFEAAQLALAEFRDSNQGNLSARAQTDEQRLNSEYQIAFNLYNGLTQQYEEAKLKVQETTPVFKTLEPVQVPINDETSGAMILIVFIMLSGIGSIGWIFIVPLIEQFSTSLEE